MNVPLLQAISTGQPVTGDITVTLIECDGDPVDATSLSEAARIIAWDQYDARRVVQYNTAEGWASDVSEDVAREVFEIRTRACIDPENPLGDATEFCEQHLGCGTVERMLCEWAGG